MNTDTLTIYLQNLTNTCLTKVVEAISALKYILGFDIDLKAKKVVLVYESGYYQTHDLRALIYNAVDPSDYYPSLT